MCQSKVKILISYHKPAVLLKDDILTPIHVGRTLATESSKDGSMSEEDYQWMLDNMIGDDTGENISHLNRTLNELTSIYWAWKNYDKLGNPDYIGFMHYRRIFILNKEYINDKTPDFCNMIRYDNLDENYAVNLGVNIDNILKIMDNNKCIVCSNKQKTTPYQYHSDFQPLEQTFDRFIKEIKNYRKDMANYIEKYLNGKEHYWSNMFIVPKKIFFDYCEFIFDFLFYFRDKIELYKPSVFEKRMYISEMLSGIFWTYIKDSKKADIISYPVYFIENTDLEYDIKPAFGNKNISVCFASDNNYIKYLSVAVESLISASDKNNNYDILIFEKEIKKYYKNKILSQISSHKNISVRFINIKSLAGKYIKGINKYINHYNESIFYRYFIPKLLKLYDKTVYLDCDLIILDDIANLYNIDLENKSLGAVRDIEEHRWLKDKKIRQGVINFNKSFGILDSTKYFNSGVLVMNLNKMREKNATEELINITVEKHKYTHEFGDQDVLNGFFYDDVKYIDTSWNIEWIVQLKIKDFALEIDEESALSYNNALKNPKIIHYCDIYKPWKYPELELSDYFWKYAKRTPFYEEIIYKNTVNNNIINNNIRNINSVDRFSIADFILSVGRDRNYILIIFFGIRLNIKTKPFVDNKFYENAKDKIFSVYENEKYIRTTIFGFKITVKK